MSKRRRSLTQKELEEILAAEINIDNESDFDSDDSMRDPDFLVDTASNEENDEESSDIEEALQDLAMEEAVDEANDQIEENNGLPSSSCDWSEYVGRHKNFEFTGLSGPQQELSPEITPLETFLLLVDDEVINLIVTETNRFAVQTIASKRVKKYSRIKKWTPTNPEEIKKFLGLTMWMGLVRLGALPDYWATKGIYRQDIPKNTMSRNRYQLLLTLMHFNDNETMQNGDRLGKIQPLIDILQNKFQSLFQPDEDIVIDETLVPWRGRLIFRQYIPNKAHKYGIKLFKLCSIDGYTWALEVYAGKSASGQREIGLASNVCLRLCQKLLYQGRTLYVDNFYTSYELARTMLEKLTHVVGTVRANKKNMPTEVLQAKLKRGEMVSREDENGIVILKWRDTRDVRLLSTKHAPIMVPTNRIAEDDLPIAGTSRTPDVQPSTSGRDSPLPTERQESEDSQDSDNRPLVTPRKKKSRKAKEKPMAILAYNKGKSGIDLSDQMASYATTLRKGVKWYRKLGMELLLGVAVVNAWVLYKRATKKKIQIRAFRDILAANLLGHEQHSETPRVPTSTTTYHHLAVRIGENEKKIRRKCSICYSKLQKTSGRIVAKNRAKMTHNYCKECPGQPQMCLSCFNEKH